MYFKCPLAKGKCSTFRKTKFTVEHVFSIGFTVDLKCAPVVCSLRCGGVAWAPPGTWGPPTSRNSTE